MKAGNKRTGKRRPRGAASPASRKRLASALRQQRAVELRLSGRTFESIAQELGYASHAGAQAAVDAALARNEKRPTAKLREEEIARLSLLAEKLWARSTGESSPVVVSDANGRGIAAMTQETALDRYVRLRERIAKLAGLDAPTRVETYSPDDIEAVIAEARAIMRDVLAERYDAEVAKAIDAEVGRRMDLPGRAGRSEATSP